jgi:hypothetical protein
VAELLDLAVAGEDAGAVGLELAVLADDAELEREPEDVGDELQGLVGLDAAGGLAGQASMFPWPMTSWMMSGSGV